MFLNRRRREADSTMKAVSRDVIERPSLDGELVGILAGWGRFPIATAEAIRKRGGRVAILTIRYHAEESLEEIADVYGDCLLYTSPSPRD